MKQILRIATRRSQLALWQAEYVKQRLLELYPGLSVELVEFTTEGDRKLETSLVKEGGKGLFIKELEQALLAGNADLAVHSMKDMTVHLPHEFCIAAICERASPADVFVATKYDSLQELPQGAILGTSSLRRQSQILALRPDLKIKLLRGNVNTRLRKLQDAEYDAIILARAGLERLGFIEHIKHSLDFNDFIPAVGQGAVGIECVAADTEVKQMLEALNHQPTQICVASERAMNKTLNGGCHVPIAGHAHIKDKQLTLRGRVASPDGVKLITASATGALDSAEALGVSVANDLLSQGADELLKSLELA